MAKPRRWRRRCLWLVAIAIGLRVLLALLQPWLLGMAGRSLGLDLTYRSCSLSLLGASLHLEDVELRDPASAADTPPLLRVQDLIADLSTWRLLHGEIVVVDAALDGVRLDLVRGADGILRLPAAWQQPAVPAPAPARAEAPQPVHFDLPMQVASARLHDVQLHFEDEAARPAQTIAAIVDIEATDLGRTDRPGTFAVRVHEASWLDHLQLRGTLTSHREDLALHLDLSLRGLKPQALPLAIATSKALAKARQIDGEFVLDVTGHTRTEAPQVPELQATFTCDVRRNGAAAFGLQGTAGPLRATADGAELPCSLSVQGPDLGDELRVDVDRVRFAGEALAAAFTVRARGLHAAGAADLLAMSGVHLPDGGIDAGLTGELSTRTVAGRSTTSLDLRDLRVGSGEAAITLERVAVDGLVAAAHGLTIDSVTIDGPHLRATAQRDGLVVAGIRFSPPDAAAATPPSSPQQAPPSPPLPLVLHKLTLGSGGLEFVDATLAKPSTLSVQGLAANGTDLAFAVDRTPGTLHVEARVPGVVEQVTVEVTCKPAARGGSFDVRLVGEHTTGAALAPWLNPLGIAPALRDGRLTAGATVTVTQSDDATTIDARLADVRFVDGDDVLLRIRNTELSQLRTSATGVELGSLRVDEPFVAVYQEDDGAVRLAGLRFAPQPPSVTSEPPRPAPAESAPPAPPPPASPSSLTLGPISVRSAAVRLFPPHAAPALDLGADLSLSGLADDAEPAKFAATLRWNRVIGALALEGTLRRTVDQIEVDASLTGSGMRGEALTELLPPSLACTLRDGEVAGRLRATVQTAPTLAVEFDATGLQLTDQGAELAAVDRVELSAPHLGADLVQIATLRATGVRAVAASTDEGLQVPGLLVRNAPPATTTPDEPKPTAPTPPTQQIEPTEPPPVTAPFQLPRLDLGTVELQFERLVWRERKATDGEPLATTATLRLVEPWATATDPTRTPPMRWQLSASAPPLVAACEVAASLRPYEPQPDLDATLRVKGIDTTSLARLTPSLAAAIRGTMTNGELAADLHAVLGLKRRDVRTFDFSRPFGAELLLENLVLRAEPEASPLAAVDTFEVLARAIDPRTGDVLLRSVELDGCRVAAEHTTEGTRLLGFLLPPPPAGDANPAATPQPPSAPRPPTGDGPPSEVRVDRLHLQGIEVTWTDRTTAPATILPVQDVDFELLHFSTRAFTEPLPFSFALEVHGGEVPLQRRIIASSLVAGFLSSAVSAVTGGKDENATEPRPLLDELAIRGDLQLVPRPRGQVRATLSALELSALRGLAKGSGVDIGDGLVDMNVTADLRGDEGVDIAQRTTFTWLSLSEPPGGPISTYLKLPAPLDTVLFVLRNDVGEQRIPLRISVPAQGLSTGAIASAGAEALVKLIADAVAGAAFRAMGAVTGAVGLTDSSRAKLPAAPLPFAIGSVADQVVPDDPAAREQFDAVVAALADPGLAVVLSHELSAADLARAADLANPPRAVVTANVARLRSERVAANAARERLAVPTAALYAAGKLQDAQDRRRELAALDDRLGRIDDALDEALDMLGTPEPRATLRRTRRAAMALAEARLTTAKRQLIARLGQAAASRIEVRPPKAVVTDALPTGGRVVLTVRPHVE